MTQHTAVHARLTPRQYQQVLNAYGVGRLDRAVPLPPLARSHQQPSSLWALLVTTPRGTFLLSHAPDQSLHDLWRDNPTEEAFPLSLMENLKLAHVQPLATMQDLFTVHRFDQRFTLFAL